MNKNTYLKTFEADKLKVKIYNDRVSMGKGAADDAANIIRRQLLSQKEINIVFAAAPSQNDFLDALIHEQGIDWGRINAYHMDEYIGLPSNAPQNFGQYLRRTLFDKIKFKSVQFIDGAAEDSAAECQRYAGLLRQNPPDIIFMGIGENGHIAFNDPHVAFFNDTETVKVVELDEKCRRQQVNDNCFETLELVPKYAITLTIPALMSARHIVCVVPANSKADAVKATVMGEITEECPASILRRHDNAVLYCDADSGKYIKIEANKE